MHCDICGRTFLHKKYLDQHALVHEKEKTFKCSVCGKGFYRDSHRVHHERIHTHYSGGIIPIRKRATSSRPASNKYRIYQTATAFRKASLTYKLLVGRNSRSDNLTEKLNDITEALKPKIEKFNVNNPALKFNLSLFATFQQETQPEIETDTPIVFVTEMHEVYGGTDVGQILKACAGQLENRIECYQGLGSGWTLKSLYAVDLTLWLLDPLRADSYHELSQWIRNTKCVVNVQNSDNECFRHAVMACLYRPKANPSRVSSYKDFYDCPDTPDFSEVDYPVKLKDISKFEKKNMISVNVYGVKEWSNFKKTDLDVQNPLSDDSDADSDDSGILSDSDNMRGYIYPLRVATKEESRHVNLLRDRP